MAAIIATAIFVISLAFILSDRIHRTIAALAGAVAMLIAGKSFGFYYEDEALASIDFTTIGLLLGMMIVVALLEPTGFFEYVALHAGRLSKGRPIVVFILLGVVTSVLAMFLDHVTTVVVMAPATLVIARVLEMEPAPLLLAEAMLTNVGGTATLIGDPPNILIGSAAGLSFGDFLVYSLPIVTVAWVAAVVLILLMFRRRLGSGPSDLSNVLQLRPSAALKDPRTARWVLIVLAVAVVFFLLERVLHDASPAFVAMGAAGAALLLVRPDVHETLKRVEWSVLIFFAGLFVMVGGLEGAGVFDLVADALEGAGDISPVLLGLGIIWAVGLIGAAIDNVPITMAAIPIVAGLEATGVDIQPLWWALVFGAGLGGNATVIAASANVVVVSISEQSGSPISARQWMKYGVPVTLLTLVVVSVLYVALFSFLSG